MPDELDERAVEAAYLAWRVEWFKNSVNDARCLIAAIRAYEAALWRPITEAPRDGTQILGYWDKSKVYGVVDWHRGDESFWMSDDVEVSPPTHFRPLAAQPKEPRDG